MDRLVVIGGTGRAGSRIAQVALEAGWRVAVYGRSATASTVPGADPIAADALDAHALRAALEDADAVVTALSVPRASPSPFARVIGPADLHSRSTQLLLDAMQATGVRRIVKLSAQGVGDSAPRTGWGFRALVAASNLAPAFADHAVADQLLSRSDRDWTILRPPMLSDAPATPIEAGEDVQTWTWTRLSRDAVAAFAVNSLRDPATHRRVLSLAPR